jgi:hypothetical protein
MSWRERVVIGAGRSSHKFVALNYTRAYSQRSFKTRFNSLTPFSFGRLRFEPATDSFFAELLTITCSANYIFFFFFFFFVFFF